MIYDDRAAIAAALDFSSGIAVWRTANTARPSTHLTPETPVSRRLSLPVTVAAGLAVMNCVLLGFALLPVVANI